jgi:saccharopine dehydrogenase-like NADP-dependent oxidoreductase
VRVLILGAGGDMGRFTSRAAVGIPAVERLIVTDRAGDAAARLAEELGPTASGMRLDVTDRGALAAALADADVVLNTVGPFFRFGVPTLRAAIDARCHYLDICDDWEPTLQMLELDSAAKAAGVIAVIGVGASPGVANLLGVLAAGELDATDRLITGWNIDMAQPEASAGRKVSAAIERGIKQMTGTIRVLRDGRLIDERPLRRIVIEYPGVGRRAVRSFGHPEAVTLGRTVEGLRDSVNVAFGSRTLIAQAVALGWLVDHRLLSAPRAARLAYWDESKRHVEPLDKFKRDSLPPMFAHAAGRHDGRPATVGATLSAIPGTSMGAATGIPLGIGLKLLTEDKITAHGVHAPEAAINPTHFFDALAEQSPGVEPGESTIVITRSWDPDPHAIFRTAIHRLRERLELAENDAAR